MSIEMQHKIKSSRMISVLDWMIGKDLFKTFLSVISVVVIIIVSRKFIRILMKAIEGNISNETVVSLLGLKVITAISAFLPASVFMAILLVLGRLYRDQEMAAVASAGGGISVIYRAVFLFALPLSVIAGCMSMIATPWAEAQMRILINTDEQTSDIRGISAGRFRESKHGEMIFYTETIDRNNKMHQVFVQNREGGKLGIVNAKFGQMKYLPGGLYLVLEQGERVLGLPGKQNFIIEKFTEYGVRLEKKTIVVQQEREGQSTAELWRSHQLLDIAEIQQRLATPLGVIFLSLIAVPLAKLSPRGGVYGSLMVAFGIYFIYGNLRRVSHSWVVNEIIPVWMGYVWVYLLLILFAAMMLVRLYGYHWIMMQIKPGSI